MSWLEPLFQGIGPGSTTLVLCRSSASVAMIRREIATRGGAVGIAVTSPLGLARAIQPSGELRSPDQPLEVEVPRREPIGDLWERIAGRRGLQRLLLEHVDRARLIGSRADPLDPGLAGLVGQEFEESTANQAYRHLLDQARQCGPRLGTGHDYSRVFAIGFGDEEAGLPIPEGPATYYRDLLDALGAVRLAAPICHQGPMDLHVVQATDVVGESRWVAAEVSRFLDSGGVPEQVLVLVSSRQDADRVRAALARSGIPASDDGARALSEHGLTALLHRLLPWFGEPANPDIDGDLLRRLLQSRLLDQGWAGSALEAIRQEMVERISSLAPPDPTEESTEEAAAKDPLYLSRRQVPKVLRACHVVRAPLSTWIESLEKVALVQSHPVHIRRQALVIRGRLTWLQRCRGEGEQSHLLGQFLAFLQGFGIKTFSGQRDTVAEAIQGALNENRSVPATEDDLEDVLAGAVASGEIHQGVVLLPYRDYDGRDSDLLLVTGLHSKGLGHCPEPDPFFDSDLLGRLGVYQGEHWLGFVERQLLSAIGRARQARACVSRFDASGRAAAPHLYLGLDQPGIVFPQVRFRLWEDSASSIEPPVLQERVTNYGLRVDSPETRDLNALARRLQPAPVLWPSSGPDDASRHAALMASVEWIRSGAHVQGYLPRHPIPDDPTLLDYLQRYGPAIPTWAAAYLGNAREVPGARLSRDANLSATYAFEPMTHCLYQAFAKVLLRLREPETITEELDAKETGTAAHEALRRLGKDTRWRVDQEQVDEVRKLLGKILSEETERQVGSIPAATAALRQSRQGMLDRWSVHWSKYAEQRVEILAPDTRAAEEALQWVKNTPDLSLAVAWLESLIDGSERPWQRKDRKKLIKDCLSRVVAAMAAGEDPWSDEVLGQGKLPIVGRRAILQFADDPGLARPLALLAQSYRQVYHFQRARYGPILAGVPEWAFGRTREAPDGPARFLCLGDQTVQVNGAIDLLRVTGDRSGHAVEVIDYKNWRWARSKTEMGRRFLRGTMAQVPLYAAVVKQAVEGGWAPQDIPGTDLPYLLAHDFLRRPKGGKVELTETLEGLYPSGDFPLEEFERLLGHLVARLRQGEFLLLPHGDTCPALRPFQNDFCPMQDLCRFRRWPGTEVAAPEDTQSATGEGESP